MQRKLTTVLAAVTVLAGLAVPAGAAEDISIKDHMGVGYFYGTFEQSPNVVLLVGGTAEEFCRANPDDPFNAEPGTAPVRILVHDDGSTDLFVDDTGQPIYLYQDDFGDAPTWIEHACDRFFAEGATAAPIAMGSADLTVRISVISEDLVYVFNSVKGRLLGADGQKYKVRASADLVVEDGVPLGDPADFIFFEMSEV